MMKLFKSTYSLLMIVSLAIATILGACTQKKEESINPLMSIDHGVFIVNEGPYGSGTGSISYFSKGLNSLTNDLFQTKNNYPLGNVVQSMNIINNKAYIVVNNANKIEVADANTFIAQAPITGLNQPRYVLGVNAIKAYITQWGPTGNEGGVQVLNLLTNTISGTITTGKGAEKMLLKGNFVYVTCSGGSGKDSVVTVINATSDAVVATINVGASPGGIVEDLNGNIWVLCAGQYKSDYSGLEKSGSLVKINPISNTVELKIPFTSTSDMPSGLTINGAKNKLYYNYEGKVISQNVASPVLDNTTFANRSFYGLGVDPSTEIVYGADAGNYASAGKVLRYNASTGVVIDSMTVGLIPNGFVFR
jgi:YVTN family beta-propeller protein